jgi:hypothetical protein
MTITKRLNITRNAVYWYTKWHTLSLSWKYRWVWLPRWERFDAYWSLHWGSVVLDKLAFDDDDPWGDRRAEMLMVIGNLLTEPETPDTATKGG